MADCLDEKHEQRNREIEREKLKRKQQLEEIDRTRKPYGFIQSSFWVIMMVHVMVCGDL